MSKKNNVHCPYCCSVELVKNGRKQDHQRYKCVSCGRYFTHRRHDISSANRLVWFREWVQDGHTIEYISRHSGYSVRTLKNHFYDYLKEYPTWHIRPTEKVNLLIDGTYFTNKVCLVLYQDNHIKATQLYRLTDVEWQDEIIEDLNNLIWLTRNPKSEAGRELRRLVCGLNSIVNRRQWGEWVVSLVHWQERHREYLNQKTMPDDDPRRGWFTHKMVRKSFVHIRRALPDLFHYLDNPDIPKSTNALESFFGHLKTNLRQHRGLSREHFKNYVKWYLFFKNNQLKYKK